jgi:hypothetical protein
MPVNREPSSARERMPSFRWTRATLPSRSGTGYCTKPHATGGHIRSLCGVFGLASHRRRARGVAPARPPIRCDPESPQTAQAPGARTAAPGRGQLNELPRQGWSRYPAPLQAQARASGAYPCACRSRDARARSGGVGYRNCLNACSGAGVQPPRPLPFLDALLREPTDYLDLLVGGSCIRRDRAGDVPGQKAAAGRPGTPFQQRSDLVTCGFSPS